MLKTTAIILGVIAVGGIGIFAANYYEKPETYWNEEKEEHVEEPITQPDCIDVMQDEDACQAAERVVQRKALQAEISRLEATKDAKEDEFEQLRQAHQEETAGIEQEIDLLHDQLETL